MLPLPSESTTPYPEENLPALSNEAADMNRLLDYEEDAILRGIQKGLAERKKA